MKTLLLAVRPEDQELVSDAAKGEFDVVLVTSLAQARTALAGDIDAIVCGVHFNEGNMLSFLDEVRANAKTVNTPFLCIKGTDGRLHAESYAATKMICQQRDVEYIDVTQMINDLGRGYVYGELRKRLHDILSKPCDAHSAEMALKK
jgi:CheY-like chemotaxis protein